MSIRELTRNGRMFEKYDYIDIEDRKTHDYKGVFIPARYADDVKEYLNAKLLKQKQDQVEGIIKFAGIADGDTANKSIQDIMKKKQDRY